MNKPGCSPCDPPPVDPSYFQTFKHFQALKRAVPDPTTLILVDEADRLHMNSLEVIRSIFDDGGIGLVLIGMPGIEKRVARFPQFYSSIGFVHEFRPLDEAQMTTLSNEGWLPTGVSLPNPLLAPDVIATLIRMSGGNFRLLIRLLTQVEHVLKVNQAEIVSKDYHRRERQPRYRSRLNSMLEPLTPDSAQRITPRCDPSYTRRTVYFLLFFPVDKNVWTMRVAADIHRAFMDRARGQK
jgi:hypothetical protein